MCDTVIRRLMRLRCFDRGERVAQALGMTAQTPPIWTKGRERSSTSDRKRAELIGAS